MQSHPEFTWQEAFAFAVYTISMFGTLAFIVWAAFRAGSRLGGKAEGITTQEERPRTENGRGIEGACLEAAGLPQRERPGPRPP